MIGCNASLVEYRFGRNPRPYLLVGAACGVRSRSLPPEMVRAKTKGIDNEDVSCCGLLRYPYGLSLGESRVRLRRPRRASPTSATLKTP